MAVGSVRVKEGSGVSPAVAAVDHDVCRAGCRGIRGAIDLEPRRTANGRSQQAVQEPVDELDNGSIRDDTSASAGEVC